MKSVIFSAAWAVVFMVFAAGEVKQVFKPERFTRGRTNLSHCQEIDAASWIWIADGTREDQDYVRFRCDFEGTAGEKLAFDVSADERFILFLDGREIARGPHRGIPGHWYYQSYETSVGAGQHRMEALVFTLGKHAPRAQMTIEPAFIFKAEGVYHRRLTTGYGPWRAAHVEGTRMTDRGDSRTFSVGDQCTVSGAGIEDALPPDSAFGAVKVVRGPVVKHAYGANAEKWQLFPTERPDQMRAARRPGVFRAGRDGADARAYFAADDARHGKVDQFNALLKESRAVVVPPNAEFVVLWDLGDYYCAYPRLTVSGGRGARITWGWNESLRDLKGVKLDRNAFVGKNFAHAFTDEFLPDGRARGVFTVPWWRCGRWCLISVKTASEALELVDLEFHETRYPLDVTGSFECDDPTIAPVIAICRRGMEMCMHEMYFDCPRYEQQMYPGDTRVEMLTANCLTSDSRLTRFAAGIFGYGRQPEGFVPMNYPCRFKQESTTYSLIWAYMFRDYMMNHEDVEWIRAQLPAIRGMLDATGQSADADGLIKDLPGWSFMDWVPSWSVGNAPAGQPGEGISSLNNLIYLYSLQCVAELEEVLGDADYATLWRHRAERLAKALVARFWDEKRSLMADTVAHDRFSEHAQCLSILCGILSPSQRAAAFNGLVADQDLARMTVYFSHYLFETYIEFGRADLFLKRLDLWRGYVKDGLKTPMESPAYYDESKQAWHEPRSDCHAWGSHPIYHLHTGVAGVKSTSPFFRTVKVAPQPAGLKFIKSRTPHPRGQIECDFKFNGDGVEGKVTLPAGITGEFIWKGAASPLLPGENSIRR